MRSLLHFCLTSALAFGGLLYAEQQSPKKIDAEELSRLLEKKDKVFFLDVRQPEEIERLGSVKGYVNIPLGELERRLSEVPKDKLIVTL